MYYVNFYACRTHAKNLMIRLICGLILASKKTGAVAMNYALFAKYLLA